MRARGGGGVCKRRREASKGASSAGTLILAFQPPELGGYTSVVYPGLGSFVMQPEPTNTDGEWGRGSFIGLEAVLGFKEKANHTHLCSESWVCVCVLSRVQLFVTPARQALLSMGFSRQEHWRGLPFPPGDRPDPGSKPMSPALAGRLLTTEPPGKAP